MTTEVDKLKEFLKEQEIERFHVSCNLDPMAPVGYSNHTIDFMPEAVAKEYRESLQRVSNGWYTNAYIEDSENKTYRKANELWENIKMYLRVGYRKFHKRKVWQLSWQQQFPEEDRVAGSTPAQTTN